MLKALLLSLITIAVSALAMAQNLVPNGSFEDTLRCGVSTPSSIYKATHWYNPNLATPDVWDCDLDRVCGMPMNPGSPTYQPSYDGTRHAGIYCWYGPVSSNTRDYLGVRLTGELISGTAYEVSIQAVRRRWKYAVDHIGVWFGMDSLWQNTTWWLTVSPQLKLRDPESEYLVEGEMWTLLKDTLIATGGEAWMVIGNFDVADSVHGIYVMESQADLAYYFIDDVAVHEIGPVSSVREDVRVWWNGAELNLKWPDDLRPERIKIYDPLGRLVLDAAVHKSEGGTTIPFNNNVPGLYLVHVIGDQRHSVVKLIRGEG